MSLADEIELQAVAVDLIAEYGRAVSLLPPGNTADATQPWKGTTGDGTAVSARAVFSPARYELVPGTAVQVGDQIAKVATRDLSAIPTTAWAILDGAKRLNIVAIAETKPGDSSFIFTAQVRASGA
jgi:hypothetical protein